VDVFSYRGFRGFGQAKFVYGGLLSQFKSGQNWLENYHIAALF